MLTHFERDIEALRMDFLTEAAMAEQSVRQAALALRRRDHKLAEGVIERDLQLDRMQAEVEAGCLSVLAGHGPVGGDLRLVMGILNASRDLERIGDLAVAVAVDALPLGQRPEVDINVDFAMMAVAIQGLLRAAVASLAGSRPDDMLLSTAGDPRFDAIDRRAHLLIRQAVNASPGLREAIIHQLQAARHLEEILELASKIADDASHRLDEQAAGPDIRVHPLTSLRHWPDQVESA